MAEFWGMITLTAATFAALRILFGCPSAIGGIIILSLPIHTIVCELVERMSNASKRRDRIA